VRITLVLALLGPAAACSPREAGATKESWYATDAPELFRPVDSKLFKYWQMAREGAVDGIRIEGDAVVRTLRDGGKYWNGSYWPLARGGVAARWRGRDEPSPIEKYDMAAGDAGMSATQAEKAHAAERRWAGWEGYCHGWSVASILEAGPSAPVELNGVTFYSDDVKALLTKFYGDFVGQTGNGGGKRAAEIGMQCLLSSADLQGATDPDTGEPLRDAKTGRVNDLACRDVNPGSFHVVIEQMVGGAPHPTKIYAKPNKQLRKKPVNA
jgi:hypothetical protein